MYINSLSGGTMARYTAKRIILLGLCWMYALLLHAQLARLGMENIRTVSNAEKQIIAYEDRVYRNSYEGVRKAIETALDGNETKTICLIILDENGIPQLKIEIPAELSKRFHRKECTLYDVYAEMKMETQADEELELLKGKATILSSIVFGKFKFQQALPILYLFGSSFRDAFMERGRTDRTSHFPDCRQPKRRTETDKTGNCGYQSRVLSRTQRICESSGRAIYQSSARRTGLRILEKQERTMGSR